MNGNPKKLMGHRSPDGPILCLLSLDLLLNKVEDDPIRKAIIDKKIKPKKNWLKAEDGVKKMRQGFFAIAMEAGSGYKIVQEIFEEHEKCGLREIVAVPLFHPMFMITKQSPYVEIFRIRQVHSDK
ncbi:hypothetical protein QAD02_011455 [Eretmocerus hayati]|uniref:Uncharacterized protein n=1 Tax=Eretmocerus hayati TaxID=131215 RepID=A0ACC2NWL5_9HYME|nr:hypothetical protein QAD02_011455 [Eretmocerus hayati]